MLTETFNYQSLSVGEKYTRDELADAGGISRRGPRDWTGVTQFENCLLLWVTLDKSQKEVNHRYNDRFIEDGEFLVWDSKRTSTHDTKEVRRIVSGEPVALMARVSEFEGGKKGAPFVYCGLLIDPTHGSEERPVRFRFQLADYSPDPPENLRELYQWTPDGSVIVSEAQVEKPEARSPTGRKRKRSAGQGRVTDPEFKRAVERRAVEVVIAHYQAQGWDVADVGVPGNPFDLLCKSAAGEIRVEVKGASGGFGAVTVTSGEVISAHDALVRTDLAIVYDIQVVDGGSGLVGDGGTLWTEEDWQPGDEKLTPTQYRYQPDLI